MANGNDSTEYFTPGAAPCLSHQSGRGPDFVAVRLLGAELRDGRVVVIAGRWRARLGAVWIVVVCAGCEPREENVGARVFRNRGKSGLVILRWFAALPLPCFSQFGLASVAHRRVVVVVSCAVVVRVSGLLFVIRSVVLAFGF